MRKLIAIVLVAASFAAATGCRKPSSISSLVPADATMFMQIPHPEKFVENLGGFFDEAGLTSLLGSTSFEEGLDKLFGNSLGDFLGAVDAAKPLGMVLTMSEEGDALVHFLMPVRNRLAFDSYAEGQGWSTTDTVRGYAAVVTDEDELPEFPPKQTMSIADLAELPDEGLDILMNYATISQLSGTESQYALLDGLIPGIGETMSILEDGYKNLAMSILPSKDRILFDVRLTHEPDSQLARMISSVAPPGRLTYESKLRVDEIFGTAAGMNIPQPERYVSAILPLFEPLGIPQELLDTISSVSTAYLQNTTGQSYASFDLPVPPNGYRPLSAFGDQSMPELDGIFEQVGISAYGEYEFEDRRLDGLQFASSLDQFNSAIQQIQEQNAEIDPNSPFGKGASLVLNYDRPSAADSGSIGLALRLDLSQPPSPQFDDLQQQVEALNELLAIRIHQGERSRIFAAGTYADEVISDLRDGRRLGQSLVDHPEYQLARSYLPERVHMLGHFSLARMLNTVSRILDIDLTIPEDRVGFLTASSFSRIGIESQVVLLTSEFRDYLAFVPLLIQMTTENSENASDSRPPRPPRKTLERT